MANDNDRIEDDRPRCECGCGAIAGDEYRTGGLAWRVIDGNRYCPASNPMTNPTKDPR